MKTMLGATAPRLSTFASPSVVSALALLISLLIIGVGIRMADVNGVM